MSQTPNAAPRGPSWTWLIVLLMAPAAFHWAAVQWTTPGDAPRWLDRLAAWAFLGYFALLAGVAVFGRRALIKLLLLVYSSLLALGMLEAATWLLAPPPPAGLPMQPGVRRAAAPSTMPGVEGEIVFSVNRLGLRAPEGDPRDSEIRILCVGGSTTQCVYVTDQESWPWRLQDQLAESLNQKVFVGNAGKSGELAPHHTYLLHHYQAAADFQWVVLLVGINDLGALLRDNYDDRRATADEALTPRPQDLVYYRRLAIVQAAGRWLEPLWSANVVAQDAEGAWHARQRELRRQKLREAPLSQPPPGLNDALLRYERDLRELIDAARSRGLRPLLMTQPTLYRRDLPEDLQQLLCSNHDDGAYTIDVLAEMMDQYNDVLRRVCRETGEQLLDLAAELPQDDSVFYDDCHFHAAGCRRVAELAAEYFRTTWQPPAANTAASPDAAD